MILPEVRDPRFVTIRRGGTLADSDHRLLALWAASCAEHVLDLFEAAQPEDPRPRRGDRAGPRWVRGEVTMMQLAPRRRHAMGAAGAAWGRTACAYAAGGRGRRPRRRARARGGRLRDQGRTCRRAAEREQGCRATRVPMAA